MRSLGKLGLLFALAGTGQLATASTYNYSFDTGSILSALTASSPAASQLAFVEIYIQPTLVDHRYTFDIIGASAPIPSADAQWNAEVRRTMLSDPRIEAPYVAFTWNPASSRLAPVVAVDPATTRLDVYSDERSWDPSGVAEPMPLNARFGIQIITDAPQLDSTNLAFKIGGAGWALVSEGSDPLNPSISVMDITTYEKAERLPRMAPLNHEGYGVATPEPASILAAGAGLASLLFLRRRRNLR